LFKSIAWLPLSTAVKLEGMAHFDDYGVKPVIVQVERFSDLQKIGDLYREREVVEMWVGMADQATRRRAIDFASGITYATRGTIEKIAEMHFRLTPQTQGGGGDPDGDRGPRRPAPFSGPSAEELAEPA
jgi:hypothetical protein